jgi:hypothetical protein
MEKIKVLFTYKYNDTPLSCPNMLETAFRRREDVEVYRMGEISPDDADVSFNTLARIDNYPKSKITVWWDIEACSYHCPEYFDADIVLAPYTYHPEIYPKDKTYFFPFAYDPLNWKNIPYNFEYDVSFVGRTDGTRVERTQYLEYFKDNFKGSFNWTNGIERGIRMSQLLSKTKIALQVSGDDGNVMETRFFEIGPIALLAADRRITNQLDLDWAAVADKHYIAYNSKEELVKKVERVLKDEKLFLKMRKDAFENYRLNHTYDSRVQAFLETIGFIKGRGLPKFHEPRERWKKWAKK